MIRMTFWSLSSFAGIEIVPAIRCLYLYERISWRMVGFINHTLSWRVLLFLWDVQKNTEVQDLEYTKNVTFISLLKTIGVIDLKHITRSLGLPEKTSDFRNNLLFWEHDNVIQQYFRTGTDVGTSTRRVAAFYILPLGASLGKLNIYNVSTVKCYAQGKICNVLHQTMHIS